MKVNAYQKDLSNLDKYKANLEKSKLFNQEQIQKMVDNRKSLLEKCIDWEANYQEGYETKFKPTMEKIIGPIKTAGSGLEALNNTVKDIGKAVGMTTTNDEDKKKAAESKNKSE